MFFYLWTKFALWLKKTKQQREQLEQEYSEFKEWLYYNDRQAYYCVIFLEILFILFLIWFFFF